MVVIMAPHLQLLPLCAWGGKLSAKQWSVISDQWSQEASATSWGARSLGTPAKRGSGHPATKFFCRTASGPLWEIGVNPQTGGDLAQLAVSSPQLRTRIE